MKNTEMTAEELADLTAAEERINRHTSETFSKLRKILDSPVIRNATTFSGNGKSYHSSDAEPEVEIVQTSAPSAIAIISGPVITLPESTKPENPKPEKAKEPKADVVVVANATASPVKATDTTTVNPASFSGSFAKGGRKIRETKNDIKPMPFVQVYGSNRDMAVGPQGQPIPKPNTAMPTPPHPPIDMVINELLAAFQANGFITKELLTDMNSETGSTMIREYLIPELSKIPELSNLPYTPAQIAESLQTALVALGKSVPNCTCGCESHSESKPISTINDKMLEPVTKLIDELGMTVQYVPDKATGLVQAIIAHNGAIVAPSGFTIDLYGKIMNGKPKWFPILFPENCGYEDYPCYSLDNMECLKTHILGHPITNPRLVNSPEYINLNKYVDLSTFPKNAVSADVRSAIMNRLIAAMKQGAFDPNDANRWSFERVKGLKDFVLTNAAPKRLGFPIVRELKRTITFGEKAIFA